MIKVSEIFKDIPNYEGLYQVSNFGRVKSLKKYKFNGKGNQLIPESILNNRLSSGYYFVSLYKNKKPIQFRVHQLVAMAFLNHTPDGFNLVVDHIDNNKLNNHVDNLQLITHRENTSKGRSGSSKYTGVSLTKSGKWVSRIAPIKSSKKISLGTFENEEQAGRQYQKALKYIIENGIKEDGITSKELREVINNK